MACKCRSLSIYVESIKVTRATTYGSGAGDAIAGLLQAATRTRSDDVSFAVLAAGLRLEELRETPPNMPRGLVGQLAWPSEGSRNVGEGKEAWQNQRVLIARVVPYDSDCNVQLDAFVRFFEK